MIELRTNRLTLTPFSREDEDTLHALFTHRYVRKYLWDDQIISKEVVADMLLKNEEHFLRDRWGLWKVLSANGDLVGFVGLWIFFDESQPQLLYGLLPDFEGIGYATEASKAIMDYAFETLRFKYLIAAMDTPHMPSQKVAMRIGMSKFKETTEDGKPTVFYKIDAP